MQRRPTNMRLSKQGRCLRDALAAHWGINGTAAVEQAIRIAARQEGVVCKDTDNEAEERAAGKEVMANEELLTIVPANQVLDTERPASTVAPRLGQSN